MSQTQDKRKFLKDQQGEKIAVTEADDHVFTPLVGLSVRGQAVTHETPVNVRAFETEDLLRHLLEQMILMNRYFASMTDIDIPLERDDEPIPFDIG